MVTNNFENRYDKNIKKITHVVSEKMELIKLATFLATKNKIHNDFIIYENNFDIYLGLGVLTKIDVKKDKFIINSSESKEVKCNELTKELKNILKGISDEDWNAYGLIDFDYAKYVYMNKNNLDNKNLIEIIFPQIDINIKNTGDILIKAKNEKDLSVIEKLIYEFKAVKNEYEMTDVSDDIINFGKDKYKEIVSQAVNDINNGEYEKVILSRKIPLNKRVDMYQSYLYGRQKNTPARSYYIKVDGREIIGFSPETVVEVDREKNVYTFPLAGTRALCKNLEERKRLKKELLTDTKEIAEHAISVKLAFEELENCCEKDSVEIIKFMDVIERGTVQHLASRLKGRLKENLNEWDALTSLFPAVTATGIPKKESIEAISRMEENDRELYSGGVFKLNNFGELDVALVLRSAFQNNKESWLRVGAGIVSMSNPERELEETKEKISSVLNQIIYEED
ncbi:salicylate synthase [Clostridioides difficile CD149]|uniref:Anthranilate synthase, component TrpE n=4 Tax=Clostridioides difficile TaxID=1496 RepID=A0AB74QDQ9_CLODI|nr:salicylate synthase [Clostridioides difficile]OFU33411.1 hypothetical protein HMPREF3076_01880 [Clostridium sp. HMSC19B12]EGT3655449.1 salicylate synthase [Clostridioides difficile]EGT3694386.1 salicylate synthase [Clostridioides difficile]EGT4624889.1 salicylate synthase [Clostridioides difficile]EGT4854628.1 salicylate synthase [Clostridioides difficile]